MLESNAAASSRPKTARRPPRKPASLAVLAAVGFDWTGGWLLKDGGKDQRAASAGSLDTSESVREGARRARSSSQSGLSGCEKSAWLKRRVRAAALVLSARAAGGVSIATVGA